MYMDGIRNKSENVIVYDKVNKNGRIYPSQAMCKAFGEFQHKIDKFGMVFGELGHPTDFDISLSRASHACIAVEETSTGIDVYWKLLNTPEGKLIKILHFFLINSIFSNIYITNCFLRNMKFIKKT